MYRGGEAEELVSRLKRLETRVHNAESRMESRFVPWSTYSEAKLAAKELATALFWLSAILVGAGGALWGLTSVATYRDRDCAALCSAGGYGGGTSATRPGVRGCLCISSGTEAVFLPLSGAERDEQ